MKQNISLASCLFTPLEHVSCHMTHCKESQWMKKKVFQNDPRRFKKKLDWIQLFFWTVSIIFVPRTWTSEPFTCQRYFLRTTETVPNRTEPLKKTGVDICLYLFFSFLFIYFVFLFNDSWSNKKVKKWLFMLSIFLFHL